MQSSASRYRPSRLQVTHARGNTAGRRPGGARAGPRRSSPGAGRGPAGVEAPGGGGAPGASPPPRRARAARVPPCGGLSHYLGGLEVFLGPLLEFLCEVYPGGFVLFDCSRCRWVVAVRVGDG